MDVSDQMLGETRTAVVIRFRDHARFLPAVLAALSSQTQEVEVIGVDTGSSDGSRAIIERAGARIVELAAERFSYGRAINVGAEVARSEVVVVLSAHAVLQEATAIGQLVEALRDRTVAGAYGRLLPGPELNPLEARNLRAYYDEVPGLQRSETRFTNTFCAIRREVWAKERFDEEIPGGEDQYWVSRVQRLGYVVAYVPSAQAVYLQTFGLRRIFGHSIKLGYGHQVRRLDRRISLVGSLASAAGWALTDMKAWARREIPARWLLASPLYRLRQEIGLYVGATRAVREAREAHTAPEWAGKNGGRG